MREKKSSALKNQRGVAVVEMLPLLAVFILLFGLTFGFWASIHSGTLSSIAARHYAFEVINNRANFLYHRDTVAPDGDRSYYEKNGFRYFAVVEFQPGAEEVAQTPQKKELSLFDKIPKSDGAGKANPIKIKTGYGICNSADCGGLE